MFHLLREISFLLLKHYLNLKSKFYLFVSINYNNIIKVINYVLEKVETFQLQKNKHFLCSTFTVDQRQENRVIFQSTIN